MFIFSFLLNFFIRSCSERILELMGVEDILINMGNLIIFVITQIFDVMISVYLSNFFVFLFILLSLKLSIFTLMTLCCLLFVVLSFSLAE